MTTAPTAKPELKLDLQLADNATPVPEQKDIPAELRLGGADPALAVHPENRERDKTPIAQQDVPVKLGGLEQDDRIVLTGAKQAVPPRAEVPKEMQFQQGISGKDVEDADYYRRVLGLQPHEPLPLNYIYLTQVELDKQHRERMAVKIEAEKAAAAKAAKMAQEGNEGFDVSQGDGVSLQNKKDADGNPAAPTKFADFESRQQLLWPTLGASDFKANPDDGYLEFKIGKTVIRDYGNELRAVSNMTPEAAAAMVKAAKTMGWQSIRFTSGNATFRQWVTEAAQKANIPIDNSELAPAAAPAAKKAVPKAGM